MKRSNWVRLIAVILIISMLAAPVSAASFRSIDSVRTTGVVGTIVEIIRDIIRDIFDDWFDKPGEEEPVPTTPISPTTPTEPGETEPTQPGETVPGETEPTQPGETEPGETEPDETEPTETEPTETEPAETDEEKVEVIPTLIEGYYTVANGSLLRGMTYSLGTATQQNKTPVTTATANRFGTKVNNSLGNSLGINSIRTNAVTAAAETTAVIDLGLSVTARYSTNRLAWTATDGVTYTVERSEDNATWSTLGTATTGSYLDETAGKGTRYYYRVTTDAGSTAGVRGLTTGMNALKVIAVLFYAGDDNTTFNGSNKVAIAEGDEATALNALESGTILYKAYFTSVSGIQAVLGTDSGCYVGSSDTKFRHELGGGFKGNPTVANMTADADNSAGFTYDDSNGYWFMCSNGSTMNSIDLDEASYGILTGTSATTYYAGGSSSNGFNGTINYIMILPEILTNAEMSALTGANEDHDVEESDSIDASDSSRDIPVRDLTATTGDYQDGQANEGSADKVLDSNTSTMWHTNYQGTSYENHWIQFQLGDEYIVDGLRYQPRQSGSNGIITEYEIQVSNDGTTFRTVKIGTWENDSTWKFASFDGDNVRYVRLVTRNAASSVSGNVFSSAAEIRLTGTRIPPNEPENEDNLTEDIKVFNDFVDGGQYYIQSARADYNGDPSWLKVQDDGSIISVQDQADATVWTVTFNRNGTYELSAEVNGETLKLAINGDAGTESIAFSTASANLVIENYAPVMDESDGNKVNDDGNLFRISDNGNYLNQSGGKTATVYGGYAYNPDCPGNSFRLFRITDSGVIPVEYSYKEKDAGKLVYFPVTMFNYDHTTLKNAADAMDNDTTVREGLYFTGQDIATGTPTYFVAGRYYIQNVRANDNSVGSWISANTADGVNKIYGESDRNAATIWTLVAEENNYYLTCEIDGVTNYLRVGTSADTDGYTTTKTPVILTTHSNADANDIQIKQGNHYLCQWGSATAVDYGGYNVNNDAGSRMYFFAVDDEGNVSDTATAITETKTDLQVSGYKDYNLWGYYSNANSAQNTFYSGLVQDELDDNNEIVFNINDPGIFTYSEDYTITNDGLKDIYQYVGMPFVLDDEGYYTFDSDAHGVHFEDSDGDGDADAWHGAPDDYFNLKLDYKDTQGWSGMQTEFGDGSYNLWAPFNTATNATSKGTVDYHFGMRADLPFSMTSNGRINESDDQSDPLIFTFKGDDDIWVFIDGKKVIDLGGIHNRLGATLDFAANTITYFIPESNNKALPLASFNDPEGYPVNDDGEIVLKLFTEDEGEGVLGITRREFSSEVNHELNIFYLERGKGTSNCQIQFNLPLLDTVEITKDATKYWDESLVGVDGEDDDGTRPLSAEDQATVDQIPFWFTLYKKTANSDVFEPVANTTFLLIENGTSTPVYTYNDGSFYLHNGSTARFFTDIPAEGVTYYVVEHDRNMEGFLTPDYQYAGLSANGYKYTGTKMGENDSTVDVPLTYVPNASLIPEHELPLSATVNKSYEITAYGSIEATDTLQFKCVNYLEYNTDPARADTREDTIVIDYGLDVYVDPMANDLLRGNVSMVHAVNGDFNFDTNGDGTITDEDLADLAPIGDIAGHSGTFQFVSAGEDIGGYVGVTARDSFIYKLNKQLTEVEVVTYLVKASGKTSEMHEEDDYVVYSQAKLYVVPATVMYYEENFNGLVSFSNAAGVYNPELQTESEYVSAYQEPGVVGTNDDSPYGSDVAYLSDSHDSNGTSYFFDTKDGYVRFEYSFTGTGTSFFARTSATTGYMQVLVYNADGGREDVHYRDTYFYKSEDDSTLDHDDEPLYNIPVYTNDDLPYGTYRVLVTVATKGTKAAGPVHADGYKRSMHEFYLDGIRVMQPLNTESDEALVEHALDAYKTDNEANLSVATLRNRLLQDYPDYGDNEDGSEAEWPFAVLTDVNKNIVYASEYASAGPKEEVYLSAASEDEGISNAQSITFSLKYWDPAGLRLHMGMKAPFGSAGVMVGSNPYELSNASDCYYDITEDRTSLVVKYEQLCDDNGNLLFSDPDGREARLTFGENDAPVYIYTDDETTVPSDVELTPIDNLNRPYYVVTYSFTATEGIVSLTNIKVVGTYEFAIVEDPEIDYDNQEVEE